VILDDKFSSIVKAILWGRSVYDNIRKFLQFQLTVNLVALSLVFISACSGVVTPLNAVQMLWVNLVMDTMGALALATEPPTPSLLNRKPYKRSSSLISWPMWRNILVQSAFQLSLLLILLFKGPAIFNVPAGEPCKRWGVVSSGKYWDVNTRSKIDASKATQSIAITCEDFRSICPPDADTFNGECYLNTKTFPNSTISFKFTDLKDYETDCLKCSKYDYRHGTVIFNTFIWCQIFNEYTARDIFDEWNFFKGIFNNLTFLYVSIFTVGAQIFLVEVGGDFVRTSHLNAIQWLICIGLGFIGSILGILMRFIPVKEDPSTFFDNSGDLKSPDLKLKKEVEIEMA